MTIQGQTCGYARTGEGPTPMRRKGLGYLLEILVLYLSHKAPLSIISRERKPTTGLVARGKIPEAAAVGGHFTRGKCWRRCMRNEGL